MMTNPQFQRHHFIHSRVRHVWLFQVGHDGRYECASGYENAQMSHLAK